MSVLSSCIVAAVLGTLVQTHIVGETCGPGGCTPVVAPPPPWEARTATPLAGSGWIVGVPTDRLPQRLRRGVAITPLLEPTPTALGLVKARSRSCAVMLFTRPTAAGGAEVWDVSSLKPTGDVLDPGEARRCSASLRPR